MAYVTIPYIPDGLVTKTIKQALKAQGVKYQLGHLGELMDENYNEALKHNRLRYRPEHLKKLKNVDKNPQVVDIAFEVLAELLHKKDVALPNEYLDRVPYYPNIKQIVIHTVINAIVMTLAITAFVLYVPNVALMTTLIVLASLIGTVAFIYAWSNDVIYVNIEENT
ncbi:MAG: hypothetical protein ACPG8W_06885 [Candidatus Promineifilaceae bacterium]